DEFVRQLRNVLERRYHHLHPFNRRMHQGELSRDELQLWVANRFYYQINIPIKDALILSNCPEPEVRRAWIQRIIDHDGRPGEERLRIGFVLLMCTSMVRRAPRRGSSSMLPPDPPTGRCPISRAVGASAPAARSSPSDQNVPSNSNRPAPAATDRTASSTAPAAGTYASVPPRCSSMRRSPTSYVPAADWRA